MNFPMGVDEGYLPVWKEYSSMKSVKGLLAKSNKETVEECFRLFIRDADKSQKTFKTVKTFVGTQIVEDIRLHKQKFKLFDNQRIKSVDYQLEYGEVGVVFAFTDIRMTVRVVTVPSSNRFGIGFILKSFVNLLYNKFPPQFVSEVFGTKRRFRNVNTLQERDYVPVKSNSSFRLLMARTEKEIVYSYSFPVCEVLPEYKDALSDLVRIYKSKLNGVF